jgi:hypothetical protein
MPDTYFENIEKENVGLLSRIFRLALSGLIRITSLRVDANYMGGFRLTMFFSRKED